MLSATGKGKLISGVLFLLLLGLGVLMLYPFLWMISVSLERTSNIAVPFPPRLIPEQFSFFNYKLVFENGVLFKTYANSAIISLFSVILSVSSALLAGYAFSRGEFRGKKLLFFAVLATMMIPFEARLIPMFSMFNDLGMINTKYPLIFPAIINALGIVLVKQYFDRLPEGLRESAKIDGANEFTIFFRIFAPLSGPITATLAILAFQDSWNSFLWPLVVINDQDMKTVPLFLSSFSSENGSRWVGVTMATAAMSILPIVIVFLFLQKYIIRSIALSGLKGE
ncbi:carbohydrate ABC transporter permease [Paenibacillus crassostreae]|uniref:Sugar ABC transporter permease n=1 Tax=Paenibacillus crassostreae TaxID=1763538 RepID=A0A167BEB7_9BACL|nr:carbohydrate ABC transporter permease [Paenibacillus crassostreae]AOZ92918.1 sugar ABC transporter permease [Paenibacillus crassostreae]OAB71994.1 sugar ABC transporter permease [Paenibacillus crassostreae]